MGDGSGKIRKLILQIHFVVKMNNRINYVNLTSNVKRVHKRKEGRNSATRDFTNMELGG